MTGEGRGDMETLACKMHDLEKLRSPTNVASDWCGAGSVDYLNSNQSNQACFVYVLRRSGLILFVVADYKCFVLIFI